MICLSKPDAPAKFENVEPPKHTLPVFPVSARVPRGCFWLQTETTTGNTGGHGEEVQADQATHSNRTGVGVAAE